jgi:hypothetical protein
MTSEKVTPPETVSDELLEVETRAEQVTHMPGPGGWWRLGLLALGALILLLLIFQIVGGGAGTAVMPDGSVTETPQ